MGRFFALLLTAIVLTGCNRTPAPPEPSLADEVREVVLIPDRPGFDSVVLLPDRDRAKVEQILQWAEQAMPVPEEETLQRARNGRLMQIDFKDGTALQIQWAVQCRETGENATQCTAVRDRVVLSGDAYEEDAYVQSKELYDFLTAVE